MSFFSSFFSELKSRNVRKTMAIYISSALTTIGIVKLLIEVYKYEILARTFPVVVTLLLFGLASAFLFAWHHGKEGSQKLQKKEIVIHSLIAVIALIISIRVGGGTKRSARASDAKTIAVLPFKNFSDNKEDEYFSDGITEDILTQLSKISDLKVISRTSVMKYKGTQKTILDIGEELGVAAVLEGSVRRDGKRVRIVGQLIDAQSDEHLWAETYDREMKDVFAIQSEVARTIAEELRAKLSPQEEHLIATPPTQNPDAYAYYLRGRDHYYRYKKEDNEAAITLFKKALQLDTNYALAYAGLGDAYCQRYQRFQFPADWIDSAIVVSKRSVQVDPMLAEGYKALGLAYDAAGWKEKALEQYYNSVRFNPNFAPAIGNIGNLQQSFGNLDEALKWLKRSITVSPDRVHNYIGVGNVYQIFVWDSLAFAWYDKAANLDPDDPFVMIQRGWLHLTRGEMDSARAIAQRVQKVAPNWNFRLDYAAGVEIFSKNYVAAKTMYEALIANDFPEGNYQLVYVLQKLGQHKEAKALSNRLLDEYSKKADTELTGVLLEIGYLYAMSGSLADANIWIRKAFQKGWRDYRWLQVDPRLENLHNDRTFQDLTREMKATVDEMKTRVRSAGL